MAKTPPLYTGGPPPSPTKTPAQPLTLAQVLASELKQIAAIEREKRQVEKRLAELQAWLDERHQRYGISSSPHVSRNGVPGKRHRFSTAEYETAVTLRAQGLNLRQIGERLGVAASVVGRHLGGKVARTKRQRLRFTRAQFLEAQKLRAAGLSYTEIGRRLGRHVTVIAGHLSGKYQTHHINATPPSSESED